MITIYAPDTQDWSNNGLCALYPTSCPIHELAGGNYDLEINHPLTDDNRWTFLQKGYLIKAPVPKRDTPLIQQSAEARPEHPEHVIWQVIAAAGGRLYSKPSTGYSAWSNIATYSKGAKVNYQGKSYNWGSDITGNATPPGGSWKKITTGSKLLRRLKAGEELIYHKAENGTWSQVTSADGTTGYMQTITIAYVRTEPFLSAHPAYNTAVPLRQVRDQLFRIYDVTIDTEQRSVKALARHLSYDQARNFVKTYNPTNVPLQAALFDMSADMLNEHDFNYYTNITQEITAEWALKNGVLALLDPEQGAAVKAEAQVVRDNYDVFLLANEGVDRGVVIESGKNLLGVVSNVNDDNAVTRIMPYGTDKDGKMLLLPEVYIDSQFIGNYPNVRSIPLQVSEAVEKAAAGTDPGMTKEQCYEKMRQAVQAQYDAGCDLPDIDIKVKFVQLGDTEEYKAYRGMQQLYLYDIVTVKHGRLGLYYKTQVIGYTFDAAKNRYTDMTVGNIKTGADLGVIAGFQLPPAGISGTKLVPGTVGSMQLRELSVLAAHIGLAQIVNAHIQDATIDRAKIKDFVAEVATIAVAKIGEAWIDEAWIEQLSAKVVEIVEANIGTLIAENADIDWADIANLTAAVADIVAANIETANIGWAQIKGLVANTALFTQGATGKLYCAELMVTDANIENLSANKIAGGIATFGKLMLMGADGKLYEINVGSLGEVMATEKQLDGDNVGDYVLTDRNLADGTLTTRTLNVEDIFANSALVRQLIAQHIDADTLFANEAYINKLRTNLIESDIGGLLRIVGGGGVSISVGDAISEAATAAGNAQNAASNAQTTANAASTSAATANSLLSDLASDSKLTAVEKQSTKAEWDVIASEKVKIDVQADVYGVSKAAYATAYNSLSTYIAPLLTDLTTTSSITGTTFRANFKTYYDARQDILNAISTAAKSLADAAQSAAQNMSTRGLGMKVNYSSFISTNPGELYLHGYNSNGVADDVHGFVVVNGSNFSVQKQMVNPNVLVPKSYLAIDSGTGVCYMLAVNESTGAWTKYPGGSAVVLSSQYIFIGYAEMSDAETFTYATLWNNILDYKQITDVYNAAAIAAAASTAASNAQTTANAASTSAATANSLLSDLASDSKLTAVEKQSTKAEWDVIASEKVKIDAQADVYGISKTAYATAYNSLSTYITPLLSSLTTTSDITGITFRANFKTYYDARQDILNAISTAAKSLVDAAQGTANSAYQQVTGVTIQPGLVQIIGLVIRMITGELFVSDSETPGSETFMVDAAMKMVKALNATLGGLVLNGPVSGAGHNIVLSRGAGVITLYPGADQVANQAIIDATAKYLTGEVTFALADGTYNGMLVWHGFEGRSKLIVTLGPNVYFNGMMVFWQCKQVLVRGTQETIANYGKLVSTGNDYVIYADATTIQLMYLRLTGRVRTGSGYGQGTTRGLWLNAYCKGSIEHCIVERVKDYGIYVGKSSELYVNDVIGGVGSGDYTTIAMDFGILAHENARVTIKDKIPIGTVANTVALDSPPIQGAATPTASPGGYTPPADTAVIYTYHSGRYCDLPDSANMNTASASWTSSGPRGGRWVSALEPKFAGMALLKDAAGNVVNIAAALAGRTLKTATLLVHCEDCWAGSTTQDLFYMRSNTMPGAGDSPASKLTDTGLNIPLTNGADTVFDVKAWFQSMISTGTAFYGFGLGQAGDYVKLTAVCTLSVTY